MITVTSHRDALLVIVAKMAGNNKRRLPKNKLNSSLKSNFLQDWDFITILYNS